MTHAFHEWSVTSTFPDGRPRSYGHPTIQQTIVHTGCGTPRPWRIAEPDGSFIKANGRTRVFATAAIAAEAIRLGAYQPLQQSFLLGPVYADIRAAWG